MASFTPQLFIQRECLSVEVLPWKHLDIILPWRAELIRSCWDVWGARVSREGLNWWDSSDQNSNLNSMGLCSCQMMTRQRHCAQRGGQTERASAEKEAPYKYQERGDCLEATVHYFPLWLREAGRWLMPCDDLQVHFFLTTGNVKQSALISIDSPKETYVSRWFNF